MDSKEKALVYIIFQYLKEHGGSVNLNGVEFEYTGGRIKIST